MPTAGLPIPAAEPLGVPAAAAPIAFVSTPPVETVVLDFASDVWGQVEAEEPIEAVVEAVEASNVLPISAKVQELVSARSENAELRDHIVSLETKLDQLLRRSEAPAPKQEVAAPAEMLDLTEQEKATYAASAPVIEKIAKRIINERMQRLEATHKADSVEAFTALVKTQVSQASALVRDPKFNEYLAQRVVGTGLTRRQIFDAAHSNRDLDAVLDIFTGFTQNSQKAVALDSATAPSAVAATPSGQTATPAQNKTKKPIMFKESDSAALSRDFRAGKITMDLYKKRRALLEQADRENRIIRNK